MDGSIPSGGAAPAAAPSTTTQSSGESTAAPGTKGPPGAVSGLEAKSTPSKPAAKPAGDPPPAEAKPPSRWQDEAKRREALETLKESGLKLRVKGQDKLLDSEESLQELIRHAQRGVGADKVLAETRAEKEALAKEKAEIAQWKATKERAERGDFEARKAMGWASKDEIAQREAEWEQVPEEVRKVLQERNEFEQKLNALQAEKEQRAAEEQQRRDAAEMAAAKRVALDTTHKAADLLGIDEASAERYVPFIARAMHALHEEGLEIGVDMPPELVAQRAKLMIGELDEKHFESIPLAKQVGFTWSRIEKMPSAERLAALPKGMAATISRDFAASLRAQRTGVSAAQPNGQPAPQRAEPQREKPQSTVLNPFGIYRRD